MQAETYSRTELGEERRLRLDSLLVRALGLWCGRGIMLWRLETVRAELGLGLVGRGELG